MSATAQSDTIVFGGRHLPVKLSKQHKKKKLQKQQEFLQGEYCDCQGTMHSVMANCMFCGRIRCEKEGFGNFFDSPSHSTATETQQTTPSNSDQPPSDKLEMKCSFCGHLMHMQGTLASLHSNNQHQSATTNPDPDLVKAQKLTERLLHYAKTSSQRQAIVDDQHDYRQPASSNIWMNKEEKEKRTQIQQELRRIQDEKRKTRFRVDFVGRRIMEAPDEKLLKREKELKEQLARLSGAVRNAEGSKADPNIGKSTRLKIDNFLQESRKRRQVNSKGVILPDLDGTSGSTSVVQDDYFQQDEQQVAQDLDLDHELMPIEYNNPSSNEQDCGKVMSMHQPWASLLIHGIKQAEGRYWNTSHRGRLWIASTAQEMDEDEKEAVLDEYREMGFTEFPRHYPTGSLLGCCDVEDVLPREEYMQKYSDGQPSQCDFVFVIRNPRRLYVPLSILGQPKIYKLEKHLWKAALAGLRPLPVSLESKSVEENSDSAHSSST